jgi:cytochrome c oxidase subunit II
MPRRSLRPGRRAGWLAAVLVPLALLVAGCSEDRDRSLDTLTPKGQNARDIDGLAKPMFIVAGVVGVLVFAAVAFIMVKFRRREGDDDVFPTQLHGNLVFELAWTIAPALLLFAFAVPTVVLIGDLNAEAENSFTIRVEGNQWWWGFEYDTDRDGEFGTAGDIVTATEMVIPAGQQINLEVTSNDVIHSFWIPNLNGKRDAVPGLESFWKIHADEPGVYLGQCTEFCGLSHANMRMLVRALPQDEYDAWVEQQLADVDAGSLSADAQAGAETFTGLCSACHLVQGVNDDQWGRAETLKSGSAPDLTHFASRGTFAGGIFNLYEVGEGGVGDPSKGLDTSDLEAWIRNPPDEKPMAPDHGRGMPDLALTEEQIDQVVAFLSELRNDRPEETED